MKEERIIIYLLIAFTFFVLIEVFVIDPIRHQTQRNELYMENYNWLLEKYGIK